MGVPLGVTADLDGTSLLGSSVMLARRDHKHAATPEFFGSNPNDHTHPNKPLIDSIQFDLDLMVYRITS